MLKFIQNNKGSALIICIICMILLTASVGAMLRVSSGTFNYQINDLSQTKGEYIATEAIERFRLEVVSLYKNSRQTPDSWLQSVRDMLEGNASVEAGYFFEGNKKDAAIPQFDSTKTANESQKYPTTAWISGVPDSSEGTNWVEITAEVSVNGVPSNMVMRVSFDPPRIYDVAILTKTVNCMGCHLEVYGDVGTIGDFRPGWGAEDVRGHNSGNGSKVYGSLYSAGGFQEDNSSELKYALAQSGDSHFDNYFISKNNSSNLEAHNGDFSDAVKSNPNQDFKVNGMKFSGDIHTKKDKIGEKLPQDEDGDQRRDFPNLDPDKAKANAQGSVGVGASSVYSGDAFPDLAAGDPDGTVIWGVPFGTSSADAFNPNDASQNVGSGGIEDGFYDGHLILVGTKDNPIQLSGDLVTTGDIIIKGYVEGQGTLYSGRNIYVAGDVVYKNPGQDYKDIAGEEARDQAARDDIANGKDELRLGARNNVVIGNWTYQEPDGDFANLTRVQNYDFITSQFNTSQKAYFDSQSGQELYTKEVDIEGITHTEYYNDKKELVASKNSSKYFDSDGNEVTSSEFPILTKSGNDRYNATFGTNLIKEDGSLHAWMSQEQYRDVLGTENLEYNYWRGNVKGNDEDVSLANGYTQEAIDYFTSLVDDDDTPDEKALKAKQASAYESLIKDGFNASQAQSIVEANKGSHDFGNFMVRKDSNSSTDMKLYVVKDEATEYVTQVGRIDAYLYSNKRIAGKTMGKNLVINGGLSSEEIGILAPGMRKQWWMVSRYNSVFSSSGAINPNAINDEYGDGHGAKWGKLTVHYDYRIRNGGQGYDLLDGVVGRVIYWKKGTAAK